MKEFLPTLGNIIKECDAILEPVPESTYPDYANLFKGTVTEKVIFSGQSFEEASSEYCRKAGWIEPE